MAGPSHTLSPRPSRHPCSSLLTLLLPDEVFHHFLLMRGKRGRCSLQHPAFSLHHHEILILTSRAKTRSITRLVGLYDWAPLRPGGEAHDEGLFTTVCRPRRHGQSGRLGRSADEVCGSKFLIRSFKHDSHLSCVIRK